MSAEIGKAIPSTTQTGSVTDRFWGIAMKAISAGRGLLVVCSAFACVGGMVGPASAGPVSLITFGYSSSETVTTSLDAGVHTNQSSTAFGPVGTSASTPAGALGPGAASASGTIAGKPKPTISGTASVTFDASSVPAAFYSPGNFGSAASYSGTLTYYMEVLGPDGSVGINVNAAASFSTSAIPVGGYGSALFNFVLTQLDALGDRVSPRTILDSSFFSHAILNSFGPPGATTSSDITGNDASGYSGGFVENGIYSLLTNTVYEVDLQDQFNANIDNAGFYDPSALGGTETFSGSIDPTFLIAPGVANADAYSIIFSDGIGNDASVSAAPSPAALPLFATGLGMMGLLGWRRNRTNPAAITA